MTNSHDPAAVRSWARQVGMAVGRRGRLSPAVLEAYEDAVGAARPASERVTLRPTVENGGRGLAGPAAGRVSTIRAKPHWDWARREQRASDAEAARRRGDAQP